MNKLTFAKWLETMGADTISQDHNQMVANQNTPAQTSIRPTETLGKDRVPVDMAPDNTFDPKLIEKVKKIRIALKDIFHQLKNPLTTAKGNELESTQALKRQLTQAITALDQSNAILRSN